MGSFEMSDLPEKEHDSVWKDVVLPDSVLQTADLAGLGMFEEIDGSQYSVIKARASSTVNLEESKTEVEADNTDKPEKTKPKNKDKKKINPAMAVETDDVKNKKIRRNL